MLYLIGISISLFLSLLLIGKRNKTQADKILTVWLFILCLHLFLYYISFSDKIQQFPFLFGLHFPMPLLYGPFLYLYARTLSKNLAFKPIDLLHFIPAIICWLAFVPFYRLSLQHKLSIIENGSKEIEPVNTISIIAIIISGIAYVILTSILLYKHRKAILDQFSATEKITLNWLQYLTYGIGLIWIFIIFTHDQTIFGVAVLFILFIGYFGIKQVGIFTQRNVATEATPTKLHVEVSQGQVDPEAQKQPAVPDKKYSKSGLTTEAANELHQKLSGLMNDEKLFKEGDLTLAQLAGRLNTHPNYLSQVINDKEGKNFFDYINTLRTREFIELVSKAGNQQYTLLGLAYECGFNSKSSFNKYFRKITGQSPSEYLEAQKK